MSCAPLAAFTGSAELPLLCWPSGVSKGEGGLCGLKYSKQEEMKNPVESQQSYPPPPKVILLGQQSYPVVGGWVGQLCWLSTVRWNMQNPWTSQQSSPPPSGPKLCRATDTDIARGYIISHRGWQQEQDTLKTRGVSKSFKCHWCKQQVQQ